MDDELVQMDPEDSEYSDPADSDDTGDTGDSGDPGDASDPADTAAEDGGDAGDTPADDTPADDTQGDSPQNDEPQDDAQDDPQNDEPQNDPADEGSGGGDGGFFGGFPSFSFPSLFRSFTGSRRGRQLYSPCTDRITLPCIVEDFIGAGMGDFPTCIPVHCGSSLCQAGVSSCKVETSVTPFHIGVHFGDGKTHKGSPEENIGACLRYKQLPCS